jgi:MerR family transcriptional regulator, light-induced transcriptional regulator
MDQKAIYNIGAITRITGIPITTLHAWEHRYQFPDGARTPGGHRLYSEKDIALLSAVKGHIKQGMSARQAVTAVQNMDLEGRLPVEVFPGTSHPVNLSETPDVLRERLFTSLLHNDLESADRLMGEMLAFFPPEELTLNVIGPVLSKIGEGWEKGDISVATEHLASNYLRHRLLMWMVTGPRPRAVKSIILACSPGEFHEGGLLMLGVLLRRQGWPVAYLGQDVPFKDLSAFVKETQPSTVVLVAMREETAHQLAKWPKWIKQSTGRSPVLFGGRVFVNKPLLREIIAGKYLGDTIQEGLDTLIHNYLTPTL